MVRGCQFVWRFGVLMVAEMLGGLAALVHAIRADRGPAELEGDHGKDDKEDATD